MPFGTIDKLLRRGEIVLWHRYDQGTFHDFSGNGNEPSTISNCRLEGNGLRFDGTNGYLEISDSPELQLTQGSIVLLGKFGIPPVGSNLTEVFVSKRDAGGTNYEFFAFDAGGSATGWSFYDGAAGATGGPTVAEAMNSIVVTFVTGATPISYRDGIFDEVFDSSVTVTEDDAPLYIGNRYTATLASPDLFHGVMIVNRELTGSEIAAIHDELMWMRSVA